MDSIQPHPLALELVNEAEAYHHKLYGAEPKLLLVSRRFLNLLFRGDSSVITREKGFAGWIHGKAIFISPILNECELGTIAPDLEKAFQKAWKQPS
ncbi:MAG TPA: hypothetical protein VEH27_00735 [Methylomirabilota bacterium]|nr:hypothetical protein [Methylomirabilota bacterium]